MRAEQHVAVVTGGNRGIGLELCRQLAARDYLVVLGSRDLRKGELAAKELDPAGSHIVACQLDVDDYRSVDAMAAWVVETFGRTDVVVNNAAIMYDRWATASNADLYTVVEALDTNLFGAWRVTQALLPLLRSSPRPRIVNVSSEGGSISVMSGGAPAYSVSKAALNALTRLLAGELARDGILVNAVCPGWTATDLGGGGRSVAEGAASVLWAVALPNGGPTGTFTRDGRELPWLATWDDPVEQFVDDLVVELVADDPAVAFGADGLARPQEAEGLGDRGIADVRSDGQVGDADRAGRLDGEQEAQPGGIGEEGEPLRPGLDRGQVAEAFDGLADLLLVDDPAVGAVGGNQVHADSLPEQRLYI